LCSLKLLWQTERTLRTRRPKVVDAMRQRSAAWVDAYPGDDAPDQALMDYVSGYPAEHEYLFGRHVLVTFRATVAVGVIGALCALKVRDPGLTLDLLSGIEGVESAEPARIMWKLGRMVAASSVLTRVFETGVDAKTWETLQGMPEAREFTAEFGSFLARYGYRGPNEWELASESWRMRPHVPLKAIDRMRLSEDDRAPGADFEAQLLNSRQAARYARRKLNPLDRLKFRKALPAAKIWQAAREESKSAVIRAVDQTRRALNELARRTAERHGIGDWQGAYMLTWSEFPAYRQDPRAYAELIAERRRTHQMLADRIPPFLFEGDVPALESWKPRVGGDEVQGQKGDILEGIGGSPGRVVGRARIVLDTANPDVLEPGDILVAPITDPSWTPLFLAAAGVVVDVGAVMSHSVIVSRDLGIPCVVSVTDATRVIPDGALIEIDGDTGTVTILSSALLAA
jgi:pyruvate,water dikinase